MASLRLIPNLQLFRPADGFETALAWGMALERTDGPTALVLTRQKLPAIERTATGSSADPRRGAYLIAGDMRPDAVIAATGSELHLAVAARDSLLEEGLRINVVSIPCLEIFRRQDASYRLSLFPRGVRIATIEAGRTEPWRSLAGADGLTLGIDRYGASAPGGVVGEKFGFTPQAVTERIRAWLA